jgi:hypothetical protein
MLGYKGPAQPSPTLGVSRVGTHKQKDRPKAVSVLATLIDQAASAKLFSSAILIRIRWAFRIEPELFAYEGGPPVRILFAPEN